MILSLDTATTTGWAAGVAGGTPQWGARTFRVKSNGELLAMFRQWLGKMCFDFKPRLILFEGPYIPRPTNAFGGGLPMNMTTLRRLIGLVETVSAIAYELNIPCYEATTSDATKFLTGRARWGDKGDSYEVSRAKKKAAVIAACRRYGWDVDSDDPADALALWALAEDQVAPQLSDRRRREAADRERLTAGEGPLFPATLKANAPGPDLPGALSQPDEMEFRQNGVQPKNNRAGRKNQSIAGDLFRKSA